MSLNQDAPNYQLEANQRKAKRIYQRLVTGLQIARNGKKDMRFLTLTTDPNNRTYSKFRDGFNSDGSIKWGKRLRTPKDSFDILRQRIKRARVNKEGFTGFNLNKYYCLRTSEGYGVLHIIFWGGFYIPETWLRQTWLKIHGAYEARILFVHDIKDTVNKLVGYLLDRYLLNQPIKRMSYGWGWAWLGFCKSWANVKYIYYHQGLYRGKGEFRYIDKPELHSFKSTKDRTQAIPFWRGVLWQHPITNRQSKFYYPNRGWNHKFF